MNYSKILKKYKEKAAKVESSRIRIMELERLLELEDLSGYIMFPKGRELGMPGAPLRSNRSPVENAVIGKELTKEVVKEMIEEENSRIFWYRMEVNNIKNAVDRLNEIDKFLLDRKYFEDYTWDQIEYEYNNRFKGEYKATEALQMTLNRIIVNKVIPIIKDFYQIYGNLE